MSKSPRRAREPSRLDERALSALLRVQQGVVSRRQVRELGGPDRDIARRLSPGPGRIACTP